MRTTIDEAGRLVIPKSSREAIGIQGRQEVEIQIRDGRLEIEAPPTAMHLEEHDGVAVAMPDREVPALTADAVRETLERTRR